MISFHLIPNTERVKLPGHFSKVTKDFRKNSGTFKILKGFYTSDMLKTVTIYSHY